MSKNYDAMIDAIRDLFKESYENGGAGIRALINGDEYLAFSPRPMTKEQEDAYWKAAIEQVEQIFG